MKKVAELVRNTETFERSCIASLINSHVHSLQHEQFGDGLVGRSVPLAGSAARIADNLTIEGMCISVGDFVFYEGAHMLVASQCMVRVRVSVRVIVRDRARACGATGKFRLRHTKHIVSICIAGRVGSVAACAIEEENLFAIIEGMS